ncbi:GNAT family N-acetyltransferase [Pseudodonghicola flavimaris]|uniref:GNAT family N-acetyltransferase n=1 Tax=Pseudodonghicola flavimaris TaxID=3050036 RepID=A0ABT7EUV3_9RHOB|nr:GNAT family N-acetyltransferase [Pseudodonghicola flavimaris]MDK3016127.1 GNAT family N-acetyltransferase [Pseudodonghicola flavimaris]
MQAPERLGPDAPQLAEVLALIRDSFAYMEGRIDPPSSMHRLTLQGLREQAQTAEIWGLGRPVRACVVLTPKPECLYLGKLAVAAAARRQGLARQLVDLAVARARVLGLPAVELQVRVELRENQAAFSRLGFVETGRTAHPGYDRPTSVTLRRPVTPRS